MPIDPILLEVLRNRLDAIADEMELTLLKSAASPIVKEGLDASAALFNTRGETIAQAAAIPIHLGALQFAAQRIVRAFPPERMQGATPTCSTVPTAEVGTCPAERW